MKKGEAHPAALTSKNMLSSALIELIGEREFKDITVTDLCGRAQIARRTFYRNFESIDDVLVFHVRNIIGDFAALMKVAAEKNYRSVLEAYFAFWISHAGLLDLLNRNGLTHIVFLEYVKCLAELPFLFRADMKGLTNPDQFPFAHAYIAGGLWSMLTYYIANGCKQTPRELADILLRKTAG